MCGREPLVFQPPGSDCRARDSRAKVSLEKGTDYQRTAAVGKLQSGYLLADQAADDGC
jgi:hypothetical protein